MPSGARVETGGTWPPGWIPSWIRPPPCPRRRRHGRSGPGRRLTRAGPYGLRGNKCLGFLWGSTLLGGLRFRVWKLFRLGVRDKGRVMVKDDGPLINRNDKGKTSGLSNKDPVLLVKKSIKPGRMVGVFRS